MIVSINSDIIIYNKFDRYAANFDWKLEIKDLRILFEPRHEISNNVVCATSKASDQPAHKRSLIRAFASPLSILCLLSY